MHGVLYPTLALLAWATVGYRVLRVRRHGSGTPARYAVTSAVALLAITFTVSVPAVWSLADRISGIANIAALIAHLCLVGFSITIQLLLIWWAHPAEVARRLTRRRLRLLPVVVLVLFGLFLAAGPTESHNTDFVATYTSRPLFAVYLLAYLAAFGAGLVDTIRICWPYARLVGPGTLRTGLRTTAVGAAIGLVYCAARGLGIVGVVAGWDVRRWEWMVPLSSSTGALLVIIGLTLPTWSPRLAALTGLSHQARLLRQLDPLWSALAVAVPTVRLGPENRSRLPWRVAERLHRRVIEIYDARLVLRPYLDEAVGDRARERAEAAGLHGEELAAVVEAAKLRAALRARHAGVRSRQPEQPTAATELDEVREVEQLARVADAFARSPIVSSIVDSHASDASPAGRHT